MQGRESLRPMKGAVAALDLGGTHASAGRVDIGSSTIEARTRVALPAEAGREELLELIVGALAGAAEGVARIGVAAPGPFDYGGGTSWIEHKLAPLFGVDLRRTLADGLGLPPTSVSFVNDAEAFVVGEWWSGAAAGHRRAVGVTLGTGLGSGFLEDGEAVCSGQRVPPEGAIYLLDFRGAPVEETISRGAVLARYGDPGLDVDEIAGRARGGDQRAATVFLELGRALGELLEPWLRTFEATCLVVGGAIARAWDLLAPGLRETLRGLEGLETIAPAARLDDAALLGAAHRCVHRGSPARRMHPQVARLRRERISAGTRPLHELTVSEARAAQEAETPATPATDGLEVVEPASPVPIRIFRPIGEAPAPVCIWLPGGGWVLDSHRVSEHVCSRLAAETPCAVAAVRYRLAPEHPFPAALEDCVDAVRWIAAHGPVHGLDPTRLAIGGTSAGGNLAAAVALRLREAVDPVLVAQILVYPALLHGAETRSMDEDGDPVFFDRRAVEWCWFHYLRADDDGANPLASPLRARGLRGLPSALVLTAELDPLRDEGELYAQRLRAAGVPTRVVRFDGMPHGFFSLPGRLDVADEARSLTISALRDAFAQRGALRTA
jgi:acetyl esterase/lipase/predicted NBD/HSP70 family sugar kinase